MIKRKLPIGGIQTFSKLRKDYDVYVDKTMHIYNIASRYKTVFLSRPRRFGKSLLCSTIESVFRNQRELFNGLAISNTDWQWKEYPVIHFDLTGFDYTNNGLNVLISALNDQLDNVCNHYGISTERSDIVEGRFAQVIAELSNKLDQAVVIIDEYDNPLFNTMDQPLINAEIREKLKGFYSVLKQSDRHLRFSFITGVTKFAQVSMFSGFNQPKDISMVSEYYDICGITQEELEMFFAPEIESYAIKYGGINNYLEKMKTYYNGYFFTKEKKSVYNTYGILNHFDTSAEFAPYWSISGEPSFARKHLETKEIDAIEIENALMDAGDFSDYKDDTISIFALLYQTGYLTIADYDEATGYYKLDYPNTEVRQSLAKFLSNNYSKTENIIKKSVSAELVKSLAEGRPEVFLDLLKTYLNKVDYSLSSKITEYYFEFAVSNIINLLGLECKNEVHTANGRMDSVIFAGDYIYIFEFKVNKPVKDALLQLSEKNYLSIYSDSGKTIFEIAIVFSREKRNIIDWKIKR